MKLSELFSSEEIVFMHSNCMPFFATDGDNKTLLQCADSTDDAIFKEYQIQRLELIDKINSVIDENVYEWLLSLKNQCYCY